MIYLLDDKKERQNSLGWSNEKLELYKEFIHPIYLYQDIEGNLNEEIFTNGNVILFHESFFENPLNENLKDVNEIRTKLEKFAKNNQDSVYVSFSGSNNSRTFEKNSATIPVYVLYQNLETFIEYFKSSETYNIEKIIYGDNFHLEEELLKLQEDKDSESFDLNSEQKKILFLKARNGFENPFEGEVDVNTIFNKYNTDKLIEEKLIEWLNHKKYDNIYIPLCYGNVLSDFNGLRLTIHIRCTHTKNQLTPIYIYSFVNMNYVLDNEYMCILKTKNVFFIDCTSQSFKSSLDQEVAPFLIDELPLEMSKLKLNIPKDYFDNHSIANEWGIYQLARNSNVPIEDVVGFDHKKLETIYFKWLIVKNNLLKPLAEEVKIEQKKYTEQLSGLKVLGKIDVSKFSKK